MKDEFKRQTFVEVGPGGVKCPCCAPAPGKEFRALKRRARRLLKAADRRAVQGQEEKS